MFLPGLLQVLVRGSYVAVQTCPMLENPEEGGEIYGQLETTYTHENGSYTETLTISPQNVAVGEECPLPEFSTTYDEGIEYGEPLDMSYSFSSPRTRSDVRDDLPAADWGDFEEALTFSGPESSLHSHLEMTAEIPSAGTSLAISGASSLGGGMASISASKEEREVKFRLCCPLACTVTYEVGSQYLPVYGEGEPEEEMSWGGGGSITLTPDSPEHTVAVPVLEDYAKKIRLTKIVWHPWS